MNPPQVGDSWSSHQGKTEVVAIDGETAFIREERNPGVAYKVRTEDLPRMREVAAKNLEFHNRMLAQEAEARAREAEARALDGWEDTMSAMARGRAQATLTVRVCYRGKNMTRRDVVRLCVSEGAKPGDGCVEWEDGRFLRLPKIAIDYARWLTEKGGAL